MPKVSIIIPVHNLARYIEQAISSVTNQGYKNLEIICVDDHSKDKSISIIEEIQKSDDRIKIYHSDKQGQGAARNLGIRRSTGKYILFLDGDDYYLSTSVISDMVSVIESKNIDFATFGIVAYDEISSMYLHKDYLIQRLDKSRKDNLNLSNLNLRTKKDIFNKALTACNKIYKKDFLVSNKIFFPEGTYFEDIYFSVASFLSCDSFYIINKPFYAYRINRPGSTMTSKVISGRAGDILLVLKHIKKDLIDDHVDPDIRMLYANFCVSQIFGYIKNSSDFSNNVMDFLCNIDAKYLSFENIIKREIIFRETKKVYLVEIFLKLVLIIIKIFKNFAPGKLRETWDSTRSKVITYFEFFPNFGEIKYIFKSYIIYCLSIGEIFTLRKILINNDKKILVMLPAQEWNTDLYQRQHHLAKSFAEMGYLVFFCTPNFSKDKVWRIGSVAKNIYISPSPILLKSIDNSTIYTSWPTNKFFLKYFSNYQLIYDFIDELNVFYLFSARMQKLHESLLRQADLVLATADKLFEEAKIYNPKKLLLSPNAVDADHFRKNICVPQEISDIMKKGPIIGYYGAIAEWFDYELLGFAASKRPNYQFVIIGPMDYDKAFSSNKRLLNHKNIHFLGPKSYQELPGYLAGFSVATIPFKVNKITESTSPVKLFEYMAGGKPIVTTAMHECKKYKSVLIAESNDDFVLKLDKAISLMADTDYLNVLRSEADQNTWNKRVKEIVR